MIRAVLYLRSSKDRADASPAAQRRALEEMAQARGIAIVGEFVDAVESGKDDDRPGFQKLLAAIRQSGREWDHILALDTARIARGRYLAIIFEHECMRRGIRILYKSLPDADPITGMLLKSILQAMDEWHSMTSKDKGVAGMAENVRQGFRAGGSAPRGYRLAHMETGAIREGEAVSKTKLTLSEDALKVRAYLQHRVKGVKRVRALELVGVSWPISSLVEMERNALMYAGHTTWKRSSKRTQSGYDGGTKWRPRTEWEVKRDTHEAIISEEEAEIILAALKVHKRGGGHPARQIYLLSGLMTSPSGETWVGDGGGYRLGKGRRIESSAVERAVVGQVVSVLQSESMAAEIATHYRAIAKARLAGDDVGPLKRRISELDKKIARLADLMTETSAPGALLRQIEAIEEEREKLSESLSGLEAEAGMVRALKTVSVSDVQKMLKRLADEIAEGDREVTRDALRQIVAKVQLSPETFEAEVHFRVGPASKSGVCVATPPGFEPGFIP